MPRGKEGLLDKDLHYYYNITLSGNSNFVDWCVLFIYLFLFFVFIYLFFFFLRLRTNSTYYTAAKHVNNQGLAESKSIPALQLLQFSALISKIY